MPDATTRRHRLRFGSVNGVTVTTCLHEGCGYRTRWDAPSRQTLHSVDGVTWQRQFLPCEDRRGPGAAAQSDPPGPNTMP